MARIATSPDPMDQVAVESAHPIARLQRRIARVFKQRCFYLFVALLALIMSVPFIAEMERGRILLQVLHMLVLTASVAAVGRTPMPFVIALLLGIPALGFQLAGGTVDDTGAFITLSSWFYLAFYVVAIIYLMRYVFSPKVMTNDKLFGAAAGYLMLGIMFAVLYTLFQRYDPGAFGVRPGDPPRAFYDLLYMSFGVLSSNGPGDIVVVSQKARAFVILEQVTGVLFVAILIARLAGIYPPKVEPDEA
jgi:hypothetical protein